MNPVNVVNFNPVGSSSSSSSGGQQRVLVQNQAVGEKPCYITSFWDESSNKEEEVHNDNQKTQIQIKLFHLKNNTNGDDGDDGDGDDMCIHGAYESLLHCTITMEKEASFKQLLRIHVMVGG
jgi:hypothetical protein